MQPVSQLFPSRQGLKILPRHGADGQRQHHVYNGGQQYRRQYRPSLGQKAAEQAIAGPGRQRHHRRQKNGLGKQGDIPRTLRHQPCDGCQVDDRDQRVAVQCAHRCAPNARGGIAHHQVVGDDLQYAAAESGDHRQQRVTVGLQDAVGGHHQAYEHTGQAQERQVIGRRPAVSGTAG